MATVPQVDFSTLGDLGNIYQQAAQRAQRQQTLAQLAQGTGPLDYNAAARASFAGGDPETGLTLAKLGQQQYLTSPDYITQTETAKARVAEQFAPKTADITLPGGDKVTVQKGPNGYAVPQIQGLPPPDPGVPPGVDAKKYREARATQLANIDDKSILEADKAVQSGGQAVQALGKALELNRQAFSGPLASKIGYGASFLPKGMGGDAGVATEELTNTVTNQALENLRGIFGGNPTEGERKILLDVQGAVAQSPDVRERIYKNAIDAANARIQFNKQNAEQMRSGRYLLPEAQRSQQTQSAPAPQQTQASANLPRPPSKAAYDAMPSGTRFLAPDGSTRVKP